MPPGPWPKPLEQRIREGNRSKHPIPEPVLVGGRPVPDELAEPPADLPADGQALWHHVVPDLAACGIVDRVDIPVVEAMCTAWARICQARRVIANDGLFQRGSRGQVREHAAVKIERESTILFERLAASVGIGPVGRTRLGLAEITRRSMAVELAEKLGPVHLEVVEGTAEES